MSSPVSKSPELSDKSKKYDRQIRLWGDHGQNLLENSNICLINANAFGTEILKGIILPGIGSFTIVDGAVITEEDVGSNFFLDSTSIGLPRAKCCRQLLQEMNPDVNGDYVDESIETLLTDRPDFFETFDVVIGSSLSERTLLTLAKKLWDLNIPFFYCRSLGLFGSIRLQIKEHCIVESHPDNQQSDLRLVNPFLTLKQHLESVNLSSKIPWLIVLYKFLKIWQEKNNGNIPKTYKEKTELREMIRSAMTAEEENYEEAIKAVNSAFESGKVPSSLQSLFDDDSCNNLNKQSKPFWILTRALRDFIQIDNDGLLPVRGVLPDMTADTESYITLQNIYRQQAMQDADNVFRRAQELLKELGLSNETITEKCVRLFCREASGICIIRGTKIEDEYEKANKLTTLIESLETQGSLMEHYVAFRAFEKFQTEYGYIPGYCNVETDIARFKIVTGKMLSEWGIHTPLSDDLVHEVCRYGGCEVHSVSAYIGGCTAHEVIKIITKQYKPIDNTFIYNAISTETATYKL